MERALIAVVVVLVVAVLAYLLGRRRAEAPTQPRNPDWPVPAQLDREDFDGPEIDWLVAVFTSATCNSCELMTKKAMALASPYVAVQEIPFQGRRDLHERYGIEAVPCVAVADAQGIVQRGFIGSVTATDLWSAVADARDPGSTPEPHLGRHRSLTQPAPQVGAGPSADAAAPASMPVQDELHEPDEPHQLSEHDEQGEPHELSEQDEQDGQDGLYDRVEVDRRADQRDR